MRIVLSALLFLVFSQGFAQQKFTICGTITDAGSKEFLRNATIIVEENGLGTTSNNFGFYSITLPSEKMHLVVSYSGYKTQRIDLYLSANQKLDIALVPLGDLDEVVVSATSKKSVQNSTQMSAISVPVETIKSLPKFLGETDIMRVIQMLPGVQGGQEGQSGVYVRGGGPDQNLILLDGVPVYNVSHLFGFFSVFNSDAIKSVDVIKGGFPARFGGRLSSVIDIQMKEGNKEKLQGEGGIGLIASRLTLEGPLSKNKKSSFMVSGRRTYIDLLAKPLIKAQEEGVDAGYFFYDLNAKANVQLNDKNALYLSGYFGKDKFYANETYDMQKTKAKILWGNTTAVVRWNHIFSNKLFGNLTTHFSKYQFEVGEEYDDRPNDFFKLKYYSGIEDVSAHYDFDFIPSPNHFFKFGTGLTNHIYRPGAIQVKEQSQGSTDIDSTIKYRFLKSVETDTYVEDDIKLNDKLKLNLGLHFTTFSIDKKNFYSLQPRASARYLINPRLSAKLSYTQMNQYIHLLSNAGVGLPTDLWVPVTAKVPPQAARQVAAGLAFTHPKNIELTAEAFYKKMDNLIEYSEGANYLNATDNWEDKVEIGKGDSYGLELFAQKKKGRLSGMAGYTLSWSNRSFENINFGKAFPYKYDRRHDVKIAAVYKANKKTELSATWVFATGNAVTLPTEYYFDDNGSEIEVVKSRNGFRMPPSHRLDFSASFSKQKRRHSRAWVISVYNVYNHKNPFFIYKDKDLKGNPTFRQISLFPILPSISYQFKF